MLDWTSNPLVALFFASETHPNNDGAVFAYRPRRKWQHHVSMFRGENPRSRAVPEPLELTGVKIVFPMLIADRLISQSGGFTIQDPLLDLMKRNGEEFQEKDLDIVDIQKWVLPKRYKKKVLRELHRVSVNRRTLFPGLDGVGKGLLISEIFRRVKGV